MTTFEAFQLFNALKMHFTSDQYDYFKYCGKIKNSVDRFNKLTDAQRYPYKKIAEHINPTGYLVSNLLQDPKVWVGNLNNNIYLEWAKIQESLSYIFKDDLSRINLEDFEVIEGNHPKLLVKVLGQQVKLETLIILNKISSFFEDWTNTINDDIIWNNIRNKALKYSSFIKIDIGKFRGLLMKHYGESK